MYEVALQGQSSSLVYLRPHIMALRTARHETMYTVEPHRPLCLNP